AGFMQTWPGMAGYFKHVAALVGDHTGQVDQFVSGRLRGGCSYCEAANSFFQGLTADGVKAALWQVTKACLTPGGVLAGWRPIVFVHDEIILEGPQAGAADALAALQNLMATGMQPFMPDMVIRTEGKIMADRWVK
ncbi:MAG: hypothetical protein KAI73_00330, partial [Rhodospirillaceae bacterium]|nr:hypothetical protein [Rhodospirillaceae bacterium]